MRAATATARRAWPAYDAPEHLAQIEAVPLADRDLPASTYELLVRAARTWPDHRALAALPSAERWRTPTEMTFAELLGEVHAVANVLSGLGVGRRDAVAVTSPNCAQLVATILGAQLAGIVAPINPGLSAAHCEQLLLLSGARVLVTAGPDLDAPTWERSLDLARRGLVDTLLVLEPTGTTPHHPQHEVSQAPELAGVAVVRLATATATASRSSYDATPPTGDDLASLFHTGGTTGTPKLAAHRHSNEVADAWMIAATNELTPHAVVFAALPLFHVNALVVTVLAPLFRGQSVLWAGPAGYRDPALYGVFWRLVEHYRVAAMSAVPTVYGVLAGCGVDASLDTLELAMVGASALPQAVRESFEAATGVPLVEGYGLTEATCASARSFPAHPRPGAVGQRMPYQQVKTVHVAADGSWTDLPTGTVGTLAIQGPTVFPGYVVGRDAAGHVLDHLGTVRDGWLDTGDLASVDEDGFVHLAGRAKDLIIRGGHNIDPALIEDALLSHPEVTAAGAVGRPDEHSGEIPVAFVTLAAGSTADEPSLRRWAEDHLSEPAAVPRHVTVVDALPVTDVGKPSKLALRAHAAATHLTDRLREAEGAAGSRERPSLLTTSVVDGSVRVHVAAPSAAAADLARALLGRYTLAFDIDAPATQDDT